MDALDHININDISFLNSILHDVQKELKEKEELLNSINVFPIADKDTGSNFRKTFSFEDPAGSTFEEWFNNLVDKILYNAHGSSGNIIALYFLGLRNGYDKNKNLIDLFKEASDFTWENVYNPQEGTILTLMRESPDEEYGKDRLFLPFLNSYINRAIDCLFKGPDLLPILKRNRTLDSGSLGWICVVGSVYKSLTSLDLIPRIVDINLGTSKTLEEESSESFRYCVEILVKNEDPLELHALESFFSKVVKEGEGNELIMITFGDYMKTHIHVNKPVELVKNCSKIWNIEFYKIEDMNNGNENIKI